MRFLGVLLFLVPLCLGIAIVVDYRGFRNLFAQPSTETPVDIYKLVGWVLIVISGLGFLGGVAIAVHALVLHLS